MKIWMHAVSVGEAKAISTLRPLLPPCTLLVTTTTETGLAEAKRSIQADEYRLLPFFTRLLVNEFKPDLFLLSETDYWPLLLRHLKQIGCKTAVISGKLSKRSFSKVRRIPFSHLLYKNIDCFCLQTKEDFNRFARIGVPAKKMHVTGNIKLSFKPRLIDPIDFRKSLGLASDEPVITLGSTHEGEEKLLLDNLQTEKKILVVPRHPKRFKKVGELLRNYPNAILIDKMGILTHCYQISDYAIVGGSFVPIGGHDVLEPIKCGAPTLFGPYMKTQQSIVPIALDTGWARQTTLFDLTPPTPLCPPNFPKVNETTWAHIQTLYT